MLWRGFLVLENVRKMHESLFHYKLFRKSKNEMVSADNSGCVKLAVASFLSVRMAQSTASTESKFSP